MPPEFSLSQESLDAERHVVAVRGEIDLFTAPELKSALSEAIVYDDAGQPLSGSLMEYGLPRADSVPRIDVAGADSPSPLNPLHLKGTGEGSAVPGPAAIANAAADALGDGVEITECPVRAETLVRRPDERLLRGGGSEPHRDLTRVAGVE